MAMDKLQVEHLMDAANRARTNAYAPYSKLTVGASVLWESGRISCGCNVENASFGLSICAERSAVFGGICQGERQLAAVCIVGGANEIVRPCGACLQVIGEFAGSDNGVLIIASSADGRYDLHSLAEYLPMRFVFGDR